MKFILDTSYWIEYLKGNEPIFSEVEGLLENQQVIALSFVFGELLQGCKSKREIRLVKDYWEHLPKIDESGIWIDAGYYSVKNKLVNEGIGLIDVAIIIASQRSKTQILTLDKKLSNHIK